MADPAPATASRVLRGIAVSAVAFGLAAAVGSAWSQGETYDEPAHLAWSRRLLATGETERASVLHYNSKTPVTTLNVLARHSARGLLATRDPVVLRFASRIPNVAWFAVLLFVTYRATRQWWGPTAGCLAVTGTALDPNLIAHASLATVDLPYAAAALLVWVAAVRACESPGLGRGVALGAALGLAFLTKFTAFLLVPAAFLLPLFIPSLRRPLLDRKGRAVVAALAAGSVALLVIGAGYGFRDFGAPLNDIGWSAPLMLGLWTAAPHLRLPFPADFLTGLDLLLVAGTKEWPAVVLGANHPGGAWFYFLVVWLVKEPVVLLAGQVGGLVLALRSRRLWSDPRQLFLALNVAAALAYFSLLVSAQIGIRFVLMCLPALTMVSAAALASGASRVRGWVLVVVAAAMAAPQVPYLGNHLAFTNEVVWPKHQAFRVVADSNIDWGQNDEKIAGWIEDLGLGKAWLDPVHALPGDNVFSLNRLAGVGKFEQHRWLRQNASPKRHIGHTYLLFTVGHEFFERLMEESRSVTPGDLDHRLCDAMPETTFVEPGSLLVLPAMSASDAFILCLALSERLDIGLHGEEGSVFYGRASTRIRDDPMMRPGQQVWFRVEAGTSAMVARRAAPFRGRWELRGGSQASLAVLPVHLVRGELRPAD